MTITTHETRFKLSAQDKTKAALGGVKARLKGIGGSVTSLQGKLLALAGVGGFGLLLKGLVSTNAQFQTMKSSLKTVTGSAEAASAAFDKIERFATTTPFEMEEVVQSFIKLKALGLDPSEEALRSYGNTASAMGKSLDQMIEAIADAATGEFERLKEFGIRASKQGDEVEFTFQGVTTTVGNSAKEITGFLQSIGTNQFGSAMADQMKNLTPAFSNLGAALKGIQIDIGEAGLNELIAGLANDTTAFINSLDEEQIKAFTRAALNGFADLLDGVNEVVNYIQQNPVFAEIGIAGFAIFGRKGLAAILAGQALLEGTAKLTEKIGNELIGNSGIVFGDQLADEVSHLESLKLLLDGSTEKGARVIADQQAIVDDIKAKMSQLRDGGAPQQFKLGAFNDAQGASTFAEFATNIKGQNNNTPNPQLAEQTSILQEIADRLRDQTSVAVAG